MMAARALAPTTGLLRRAASKQRGRQAASQGRRVARTFTGSRGGFLAEDGERAKSWRVCWWALGVRRIRARAKWFAVKR